MQHSACRVDAPEENSCDEKSKTKKEKRKKNKSIEM